MLNAGLGTEKNVDKAIEIMEEAYAIEPRKVASYLI